MARADCLRYKCPDNRRGNSFRTGDCVRLGSCFFASSAFVYQFNGAVDIIAPSQGSSACARRQTEAGENAPAIPTKIRLPSEGKKVSGLFRQLVVSSVR